MISATRKNCDDDVAPVGKTKSYELFAHTARTLPPERQGETEKEKDVFQRNTRVRAERGGEMRINGREMEVHAKTRSCSGFWKGPAPRLPPPESATKVDSRHLETFVSPHLLLSLLLPLVGHDDDV